MLIINIFSLISIEIKSYGAKRRDSGHPARDNIDEHKDLRARLVLLEESETVISESAFTFGALKHDRHKETAKTNAKSAAQIFAKRPISLLSVILLIKASSRKSQA